MHLSGPRKVGGRIEDILKDLNIWLMASKNALRKGWMTTEGVVVEDWIDVIPQIFEQQKLNLYFET